MELRLLLSILLLTGYTTAFTFASLLGDTPQENEKEVDVAAIESIAETTVDDGKILHKIKKKFKPAPVQKPEPIKPIKKPGHGKPVLKPVLKPHVKPVPVKKPIKKPVKPTKPVSPPAKPCSFCSALLGKWPQKFAQKLPNKLNIRPTKTEYVEVTKKITVHPVCYINPGKKKPCISKPHKTDFRTTGSDPDVALEVEEVHDDPTVESSTDDVEIQREGRTIEFEYNEEETPSREGRYIEFAFGEEEDEGTTELSPSEDEARWKKPQQWATKTVVVTRIEKVTDHRFTATVIPKNCAPVSPHVPKCRKKKTKDGLSVIRELPDTADDTPIAATSVLPQQESTV